MTTSILRLELTDQERRSICALLDELLADPRMSDQDVLLDQAHLIAQDLPRRIREVFYDFRLSESEPVLHIVNSPVLVNGVPPTPTRYIETEPGFRLNDAQILHGLYGSLLGEAFGFSSQRNGSVYNTIVPLPQLADTPNSSSGSTHDFGFHVEDAFHPARGDYIGLVCMRNDERAPTTIASIDGIDTLTAEELDLLFEPRFRVGHNPIHVTSGIVEETRQAVLFGSRERPYLKVNFAALNIDEYEGVEFTALHGLRKYLEDNRVSLVLQSGEYVFIDNYRCAHARDAFEPLFGEGARWLTRVVFTHDLRKSRDMRQSSASRVIVA